MFSNLKRVTTLALLASAANTAFAAPAPVSDLSGQFSSSYRAVGSLPNNETDSVLKSRVRVQIQMQQQIDELSQEVSQLRGQLEQNQHEMQQMAQRQRDLFVELDKLRNGAEQAPAQPSAVSDTKTQTPTASADEQQAYQAAVDLILKKRDYQGAAVAFKQFQEKYPDSTYSANSHYWLGQLYFAQKQDTDAAKSFKAVLGYKNSPKRADALLKLGDIAARHDKAAQAQQLYQQVVNEYPNSSAAKSVSSKLH